MASTVLLGDGVLDAAAASVLSVSFLDSSFLDSSFFSTAPTDPFGVLGVPIGGALAILKGGFFTGGFFAGGPDVPFFGGVVGLC